MLTRRFVLTGIIAAPAVIAADRLMPVRTIVQRYATVYGVGWDFEVVEHIAWNAQDALNFARFGRGGIDKFRKITDVVYGFDMPVSPHTPSGRLSYEIDPNIHMNCNIDVGAEGFTNVSGYLKINEWRESLRPDLNGRYSKEWVEKQIIAGRSFGVDV